RTHTGGPLAGGQRPGSQSLRALGQQPIVDEVRNPPQPLEHLGAAAWHGRPPPLAQEVVQRRLVLGAAAAQLLTLQPQRPLLSAAAGIAGAVVSAAHPPI